MLVVNVGNTSARAATAVRVASAAVTPSTRNSTTRCLSPPISRPSPTTPLQTIMNAENTVSRATVGAPLGEVISIRISPTSMTVTAIARISVPNGSPTRNATTSAW